MPINVFAGPNNVGKSKLLQTAQRCSFLNEGGHYLINASGDSHAVDYDVVPSEAVLKMAFHLRRSAGAIGFTNWWETAGKYLLSKKVRVRLRQAAR